MRTAIEIQEELNEITTAISRILKAGQSWDVTSASGAGTRRAATMADYNSLVARKKELLAELAEVQGGRSCRIRPAW